MSAKRFSTVGRVTGYVVGLLAALALLLVSHQVSTAQQPVGPQPKADVLEIPQVPQVPADTQPHVIKAEPRGIQPVGPDGQPDCHGPLYYKLKKDEETRRKLDSSRAELKKFTYEVQEILVREQEKERKQLMEQKLAYTKRCEAAKEQPSLLCSAYAKRSLDACLVISHGPDSMLCRVALGLDLGIEAAIPRSPEGTKMDPRVLTETLIVRALLDAAGSGRLVCPDGLVGDPKRFCAEAEAVVAGADFAKGSPEARTIAAWVQALHRRDSGLCSLIPMPEHAEFCAAYLDKDLSRCKPRRPLVDYVDQDWSCRSILLSTRLYPVDGGSEVVLTLGSPYDGTGDCTVGVVVEYGGTQNRRDVKTLQLNPGDVTDLRVRFAGERFLRAEPKCTWSEKHIGLVGAVP